MKKIVFQFVVLAGCIAAAHANAPASPAPQPLTSVRAVRSLTNEDAAHNLPVAFQATVTYFRSYRRNLFVQDGALGIFVKADTGLKLVPGDRILVKGTTTTGYRPMVLSSDITLLGHGALPKPVPASFDQLVRGQFDSELITARGIVQASDLDPPSSSHVTGTTLRVLMDGGYVDAQIDSNDEHPLGELLDAQVEITGVSGGKFDGKHQLTGVYIHVSSLANIRILKRAAISPWSLPITPMDQVLSVYHVKNLTSRVRVSGTVTFFEPGAALVLQNSAKSIWIKTSSFGPIRIGDQIDATGFPAATDGFLTLYGSTIQDSGVHTPITPQPATWQDLSSSSHIFDLVSTEGTVVMEARQASLDEYVLVAGGHIFTAIYPHANTVGALQSMKQIPVGERIRVSGICTMDQTNPFGHEVPFKILLRTPDDITELAAPTWMTVPNLSFLVLFLLLGMLAVGARAWFIDRTMRAQVGALGYITQRRGVILEDINSLKPLAGILESITELASVSLKGAPCWCQVADESALGNCPPESDRKGLRIASHTIASHSGQVLGRVFAAFDAKARPHEEERKALSTAAELATLAIETSRLHSDLVHRSEFDMLTDIENRFSFERHLDRLIEQSRQTAGIFGLIYIDLDDFKQVNDLYGHQIGDIYLQQVAARMKHQLRPGDLLARLGGDEFGVLVPVLHNKSDVEDIALRMERCFAEPFVIQGSVLRGSASVGIALYPEDAVNNDSLLSTADAAMYVAKHTRKARTRSASVPSTNLSAQI